MSNVLVERPGPITSKYWVFVPSNDWTDSSSYRPQVSPTGKVFPTCEPSAQSRQPDRLKTLLDAVCFFSQTVSG